MTDDLDRLLDIEYSLECIENDNIRYGYLSDENKLRQSKLLKDKRSLIKSIKKKLEDGEKYQYLMNSELPINHSFTFKTIQELESKVKQLEEENRRLKE